MSTNPDSQPQDQSLEGQQFTLDNLNDKTRVIDLAFDYRGDVTLKLQSGENLEGYIYDRDSQTGTPHLKLFPKDQAGTRDVNYSDVVAIVFSGEDTASGKSWEEWIKKKQQKTEDHHSS